MHNKKVLRFITIMIPILIILIYILQDYILALVPFIPPCSIYRAYDIYCPACGNTRSITALFHGDILASLRYNIVPLLLGLLTLLAYLELATYSFGKHIRLLPRKLAFYLVLIALLILYWVVRNYIPYLTP
jgi:hypothetical protein